MFTKIKLAADGELLDHVIDANCGFAFSCILLSNGHVYGTGDNNAKQLGQQRGAKQFARVEFPEPISQLAVGGDHLIGKCKFNRTLYAYGSRNAWYAISLSQS